MKRPWQLSRQDVRVLNQKGEVLRLDKGTRWRGYRKVSSLAVVITQEMLLRDFPGSPVQWLRLPFHSRVYGFNLWLGNQNPICCIVRPPPPLHPEKEEIKGLPLRTVKLTDRIQLLTPSSLLQLLSHSHTLLEVASINGSARQWNKRLAISTQCRTP